ncbi:MAG: protein-disulfide reductase DsbD domain-containing protein [Caulobacteraceae bacterium]
MRLGAWAVGLVAALSAAWVAAPAAAAPVTGQHVQVELIPESPTIQPGKPFTVAVRLTPDKGWHSYWRNAGDAGLATSIKWMLPAGFQPGAFQWPAPVRLPANGGAINYGYESQVLLLTQVAAPAGLKLGQDVPLKAHVSWLVCADVCIPGESDLTADVKTSSAAPTPDPKWAAAFAASRHALPSTVADWRFTAAPTADGYQLIAEPARAGAVWPKGGRFLLRSG